MEPATAATKIVIADEHALFREALSRTLSAHPDFEVVAEASDGQEALELCREFEPQLVLMDLLHLPRMGGLEATQAIKRELPRVMVLVLTAFGNPNYLLEAFKAGASGYLLKSAGTQEIADAIRAVLKGGSPLSQEVAMQLVMSLIEEKRGEARSSNEVLSLPRKADEERQSALVSNTLTPRETEVVSLLAQGKTNQHIAQELSVSVSTVKHHVHNILTKLGASDRLRAVALAMEHGLLALAVASELVAGVWLLTLVT